MRLAAALLLGKLAGDQGEAAKELAYRLYVICERKGWSGEALAYNSLVISWPEIVRLAREGVIIPEFFLASEPWPCYENSVPA